MKIIATYFYDEGTETWCAQIPSMSIYVQSKTEEEMKSEITSCVKVLCNTILKLIEKEPIPFKEIKPQILP